MTLAWWEDVEKGWIRSSVLPTAQTPSERAFKLAFFSLVVDGLYPSGRQVYKRIGKRVDRKVNLNGRECRWLNEMRELFGIEPCISYTARRYRADWNDWIHGEHGGPRYPYKLRRGPKGTLVVCDEWVENRYAEKKAKERELVGR